MVRGRTNQEGIRATHLEKFKSPRRRSDVWGTRRRAVKGTEGKVKIRTLYKSREGCGTRRFIE